MRIRHTFLNGIRSTRRFYLINENLDEQRVRRTMLKGTSLVVRRIFLIRFSPLVWCDALALPRSSEDDEDVSEGWQKGIGEVVVRIQAQSII